MNAFLHGFGGGKGDKLNFRVKAYASQDALPETAAENTIAVITETDITDWIFSANEPAPAEGMVWFKVGTTSPVAFNALRKGRIMIYPQAAKQYIGNAWVGRKAEISQNGAWKEFDTTVWLYDNGKSTGYSFKCDENMKQMQTGYTAVADRVTVGSSNVTVVTNNRAYDFTNVFLTDDYGNFVKVDLSEHAMIRIRGTLSGGTKDTACVFRALSQMSTICTGYNVVSQHFTSGEIDTTIDIRGVDSSCYLGLTFYDDPVMFTLKELWLE